MASNISANQTHSDEIDLFELITQLWKSKLLILLVTGIFTALGTAYAFLSTPVFQSTAVIVPPTSNNLVELKKINTLLINVGHNFNVSSPQDIFEQFANNLDSNRYKNSFLSQPELLDYFQTENSTELHARDRFNKALTIKIPKKKPYHEITISFETTSPELSSRWLNEYITYAQSRYRSELVKNIATQISAAQNNLHLTINSKRANYLSNLHEEIRNLEEALKVAKEIGLIEPLLTDANFYNDQVIDKLRNTYQLGSKSLKAELKALQARLKDPENTPGLSNDKLNLKLLTSINIKKESIDVMTLDLPAEPVIQPTKPKRIILVALSIMLGSIAGIIITLTRNGLKKRQTSM